MTIKTRLDAVIDRAIEEKRIVGTVVMVAHEGETIYARAAGMADREAGVPAAMDTIFRLASVTKPIVAATALALVDEEALNLEAPVTEYLPWFTPALPDGSRPEITIRQLFTHTAGLAYGGPEFERLGVNGGLRDSDRRLEDNLRLLAQVPLAYAPGTRWQYSMAIDVLGAVIESIEGTRLGEAVRKYVTGPLGMHDTAFSVVDPARLATAYADGRPEPVPMGDAHFVKSLKGEGGTTFWPKRIFNPKAFHSGGAGMAGTAPDFLKFLETLRRGGDPILQPETVNLGAANQIGDLPRDPGMGFGLFGAVVVDAAATGASWANGTYEWGGVYGNRWFIDPANGISVVEFSNTALEGVDGPFSTDIRDAVYPPVEES